VKKKMEKSDITVIVEGFAEKDIELSRYSLSTKAADALASGSAILVYGSHECGIVEYMQSTDSAAVCTDKDRLENVIRNLIFDTEYQKKNYKNAIRISKEHHALESSNAVSEGVIAKVVERNKVKVGTI